MKKKIIGIFICTLLIATILSLTVASNKMACKPHLKEKSEQILTTDTSWTMSGFNADIELSGTDNCLIFRRYMNNPSTNICSSKWIWIKYGVNGEISSPEGNHDGKFVIFIYLYKGLYEYNEAEHISTFDGKALFYSAKGIE